LYYHYNFVTVVVVKFPTAAPLELVDDANIDDVLIDIVY
jgi:hypothetical protein